MADKERSPNQASAPADPLLEAILRYQQIHRVWVSQADPELRTGRAQQLRDSHDVLWPALAPPLVDVARSWLRSGIGRDICANPASYPALQDVLYSLAINLYLHVVDALPNVQVDPAKNIRAYLMTIARRGIADEYYQVYGYHARQGAQRNQPQSGAGPGAAPGTPARVGSDAGAGAVADLGDTIESWLIDAIDRQRCWQLVQEFWRQTLTLIDCRIITLRWSATPPLAFEHVAQQLGPEWTAAAVRQRHHRILARTRQHLRAAGMLDREEQ